MYNVLFWLTICIFAVTSSSVIKRETEYPMDEKLLQEFYRPYFPNKYLNKEYLIPGLHSPKAKELHYIFRREFYDKSTKVDTLSDSSNNHSDNEKNIMDIMTLIEELKKKIQAINNKALEKVEETENTSETVPQKDKPIEFIHKFIFDFNEDFNEANPIKKGNEKAKPSIKVKDNEENYMIYHVGKNNDQVEPEKTLSVNDNSQIVTSMSEEKFESEMSNESDQTYTEEEYY